jgi:hypothetical protein
MKRALIIFSLLFAMAGCNHESTMASFMESSDISLTWKGNVQVQYNDKTCQLAYNDKKHEFRVYDDRLADWFTIRCAEKPSAEGQTVVADVSWTGDRTPKVYTGLSFTVSRISEDGLIWLWNNDNRIGIIIKDIQ